MCSNTVSLERIDGLLKFLPVFDVPSPPLFAAPEVPLADGGASHYPVYSSEVVEFYTLAGQTCWSDFDYEPRKAAQMLSDDEFIAGCSVEDIRTMLTYCVRGERFGDGHWAAVIQSGRITALLKRLATLRPALAKKPT